MGTCALIEPFSFHANGELTGLDIELSRFLGQRLGKKIEIMDMSFEALIPALQSGKIEFALSNFNVTEERKKLAKQMLLAMMEDSEGQMNLWKATGGPPPNVKMWDDIAKQDPFMMRLKEVSLDITPPTHAAYYFPKWPAVHKAFSDTVIKAVTGKREDIAKNLTAGMDAVHKAATD